MDPQTLIFYLAIAFLISYVMGSIANSRRTSSLAFRISKRLKDLGSDVRIKGVRQTSAVLTGKGPRPIKEYSIVIGVVSLSNPITWLASRLAGRIDVAIMRANLEERPSTEVTFIRKKGPARKHAKRWGAKALDMGDFLVVGKDEEFPRDPFVGRLLDHLKGASGILLLSIQRTSPHLQLYITLSGGHLVKEDLGFLKTL